MKRLLFWSVVTSCSVRVLAPRGESFSAHSTTVRPVPTNNVHGDEHLNEQASCGNGATSISLAAASACAAVLRACNQRQRRSNTTSKSSSMRRISFIKSLARMNEHSSFVIDHAAGFMPSTSSEKNNTDAAVQAWECLTDDSDEDIDFDLDGEEELGKDIHPQRAGATLGKLWSKAQFPEGTIGASNYDLANLEEAQKWKCPCLDRQNCIGPERTSLLELYEHRKAFRTTAHVHGGYRDACRKLMEERFDKSSKSFIRAFKVGSLVDCCAASAGLANGVSFATWANARADAKQSRPLHNGRRESRAKVESYERGHLNAYIRDLRSTMEGPKGGSDPIDKWRTAKLPISKRWEQYKEERQKRGLPIIGDKTLTHNLAHNHHHVVSITRSSLLLSVSLSVESSQPDLSVCNVLL